MIGKKKLDQLEARVKVMLTHDMIASSLTLGALARCLSQQPGIDAQELLSDLRAHSAVLLSEMSGKLPDEVLHVYMSRFESMVNHMRTGEIK